MLINYLFDLWFSVIKQPYNVQVYGEYAIAGNTGHLKCQIPAFVREYVYVTAWLKGDTILATDRTSKGEHSHLLYKICIRVSYSNAK